MFDNILVPTDGSEAADEALEMGLELAETHEAELHVLYVIDTSVYLRHARVADTIITEIENDADDVTKDVEKQAKKYDFNVEVDIVRGIPHEEIQEQAKQKDTDLIVMGTHGRTGLRRAIMGSVTEWIVITSDIPVLTVKSSSDESLEPME